MSPDRYYELILAMTDDEKKELLDNMGFDKKERKEYE
jgi:hypothetical protein